MMNQSTVPQSTDVLIVGAGPTGLSLAIALRQAGVDHVLIDKLPFPPPNDPLVEARVKRLQAEGRNAFTDYFVAEAAVSLKQGAGRLIRSETDRLARYASDHFPIGAEF